jgi:hypothetical protein
MHYTEDNMFTDYEQIYLLGRLYMIQQSALKYRSYTLLTLCFS